MDTLTEAAKKKEELLAGLGAETRLQRAKDSVGGHYRKHRDAQAQTKSAQKGLEAAQAAKEEADKKVEKCEAELEDAKKEEAEAKYANSSVSPNFDTWAVHHHSGLL